MSAATALPDGSISVLRVLVTEAGPSDRIQISHPRVAEKAKVATRWMTRHVVNLEEAGLIEILPSKMDARGTPPTTYVIKPEGRAFLANADDPHGHD